MTEKTAWADLPNAKHIDRVIASVRQNPEKWKESHSMLRRDSEFQIKQLFASLAVKGRMLGTERLSVYYVAKDCVEELDTGSLAASLLALTAYDDCAYLLDQKPDQVKLLAGLGVESAILLLPAVIALNDNT